MDKLCYDAFINLDKAQQVAVFDNSVPLELFESEKYKRVFLQDIIQNSQNQYFRKNALENLALMSLFGETTNNNAVIATLVDIENDDDCFVLVSKIKYLSILEEKLECNDPNIRTQLDQLRFHDNSDVASEAYFRFGIRTLLNANQMQDKLSFDEAIKLARDFFNGARETIENRTDALLLFQFCNLISLSLSGEKNKIKLEMSLIKRTISDRNLSFIYSSVPEIEMWFYKIALNIQKVISTEIFEWLDIKASLNNLCYLHYEITDIEMGNLYVKSTKKFANSISKNILDSYYKVSLVQYLSAIKRLLRENEIDAQFHKFCSELVDSIENEKELKKNTEINIHLEIARSFPDISDEKIKKDLSEHDLNDPISVTRMIGAYSRQHLNKTNELITGSPAGDEIFSSLCTEIKSLLPNYSLSNFIEFRVILSDVIRYVKMAVAHKVEHREFFSFLYDENANEKDLQQSMYAHLQMTSVGSRYSTEISDIADGGRIDILYKSNEVTLPIELKKTDEKPSPESIAKNYLSQAQTYCYPYNQLGIFVVLDNSCKADKPQNPINDIRELFYIQHMEPYYQFEKKAPNYIVTVVIPGNKITPSQRSNYK